MTNMPLPSDAIGVMSISVVDQIGRPVPVPPGLSFTSSDEAILTVSFDGLNVRITPASIGSAVVSCDQLAGSIDVTVGAAVPSRVSFGEAEFSALTIT
jgi:hypothetical protein